LTIENIFVIVTVIDTSRRLFMKKIYIAVFFFILTLPVFSQALQFLSLGYNTYFDPWWEKPWHYFYGYEDYSEAIILHHGNVILSYGSGNYIPARIGYPLEIHYRPYESKNGIQGYSAFMGATSDQGVEYKIENGNLVYWSLSHDFNPQHLLNKVEETDHGIIIYAYDKSQEKEEKYEYYNIPKEELLDMFLEKYIITIRAIVDDLNYYREQIGYNISVHDISKILGGRTKKELAIFRNCLFALKGYKFQTETWDVFFKQYLPYYNGRFTNAEVMNMFSDNEKWLLDLIIKYENGELYLNYK
jgi:hypothetical protein